MSSEPSSSGNASPQGPHRPSQKNDLKDGDLSELPLHIQAVREGLLDFEHFLGLQAAMLVATGDNDQDLIPLLAYKPDGETESQQAREKKFAESALALVKGAKDIKIGGELKGFIRKWMKERVDSAQDGSSMSQKSLAYAGWRLWKAQETLEKDIPPRTSPALYLGFPMYDSNTFQGFYKDPSFNNYTQANLEKVSKHGLQCVPLEYYSFEAPTVCFPWAVLYVFGTTAGSDSSLEDSSSQSIVSRIAAAASTALSIFEGLARFADEKQDGRHIPPVIAITLAGTKTTVWLAYCEIVDERLRDHKMINIWEGNITKIWDSIQFSRIIDNLLFWAQRCLKPMVTKYLDQWRLRYCPSIPNVYSQLEKDTDMAQLVHRIQDRLSSLCISPNEDLPALIRQSIIFQEVMRPSDNEPKEGSDLEGATIYSSSDTASPTNLNESPLKAAPSGSIKVATGRPDSIPGVPIPSMASGKPESEFPLLHLNLVKILDFKEDKTSLLAPLKNPDGAPLNLLQRTLRSMALRVKNGHVISLKEQRDRRLGRILDEREKVIKNRRPSSADSIPNNHSSASPRPFVSDVFKLSFEVAPWQNFIFDLAIRKDWGEIRYSHGPYLTLQIGMLKVGNDAYEYTEGGLYSEDTRFRKSIKLTKESAVTEPLPRLSQFQVKIPWRGKSILVKLPPVDPRSTSA